MANFLTRLFSRTQEVLTLRRWLAAKTTRLNSAHWAEADGASVNTDLGLYGEDLAQRCELEIGRNAFVEGVINTHVCDVIGRDGPVLQVQTDDEGYNDALEDIWAGFWEMPDINGVVSGVDLLQTAVRMLWSRGEFLFQLVGDQGLRLHEIHPRRIQNPYGSSLSSIVLGVERNRAGRPINYYITDWDTDDNGITSAGINPQPFPAEQIIHGFRRQEPGQVRGVPWLAPCLQGIADLRDYSDQVLDVARSAADQGVLLQARDGELTPLVAASTTSIERRVITTLPPGWEAVQIKPEQPTTNYVEYYAERLRELGRPVNMPLMMVKLDSGGHNYSSARFDAQTYWRGVSGIQGWFERVMLNRLVRMVQLEAVLGGELPRIDGRAKLHWIWPTAPHVDPSKERKADEIALANNITSLIDIWVRDGQDPEAMMTKLKKSAEFVKELGDIVGVMAEEPDDEDEELSDEQRSEVESIFWEMNNGRH